MNQTIKILIACNNNLLRKGIAKILQDEPGIRACQEVDNGQEIFNKIDLLSPEVVVVDFFLSGLNGLEVVRRIKKSHPEVKIVLFSTADLNALCIFEALEAGTSAFLDQSSTHNDLKLAIKAAMDGEAYLSPAASAKIIKNINNWKKQPLKKPRDVASRLTPREREVVQLIAEGLTGSQIAEKLCISYNTVRRHRMSLMEKLGLKNVVEVVKYAIRTNMVDLNC